MNRILLILSLLFVGSSFIGCSGNDDESIAPPIAVNKTIPAELLGEWEIKTVTFANDANFNDGNGIGAYINFNNDGSIEYLDGSIQNAPVTHAKPAQVTGTLNDGVMISINNIPQTIICRFYNKQLNQVSFTIRYGNGSPHYDMIMVGKKK